MSKHKDSYQSRAVVTGSGSGIGRAFALELARRGGHVVCADVSLSGAEQTVAQISALGGRALPFACDVSQWRSVKRLAAESEQWFGKPADLLINNAGVGLGGERIEDITLADWEWIMGVNLWGVIHGCRAFIPGLRRAGYGGVLNVASAASFGAGPMMGAYNTTKAGVLALSETLSAELSGSGVHVSVLCPTMVKTNIIANARLSDSLHSLGGSLMSRTRYRPEQLVSRALDAFDAGQLHILPQLDARLAWLGKRAHPALFTRIMGLVARRLNHRSEGSHAVLPEETPSQGQ